MNNAVSTQDRLNISCLIDSISKKANDCSGLVYEIYLEHFINGVDSFVAGLEGEAKYFAIEYAKTKHDYKDMASMAENEPNEGECKHYLPFDCCPLGCGEL